MVRKLFKYEAAAVWRSMLPVEIIVLGIALLTRFIQLFEVESTAYDIVRASAIVMLVISVIVSLIISVIVSIKRFYTNMFSAEGYLTMTLPATPTQHILVKLSVAVISVLGAVLVSLIAVAIATMGEVLIEIFKAGGYLFSRYFERLGGHGIAYIFELLLTVIVVGASQLLLYYACISIGQFARKKRVLFACVAYFVYYVFTQIMGTLFIITVSMSPRWLKAVINAFADFAIMNPNGAAHMVIWGIILFYAVQAVVFFFVSRYIIKNKLNLE